MRAARAGENGSVRSVLHGFLPAELAVSEVIVLADYSISDSQSPKFCTVYNEICGTHAAWKGGRAITDTGLAQASRKACSAYQLCGLCHAGGVAMLLHLGPGRPARRTLFPTPVAMGDMLPESKNSMQLASNLQTHTLSSVFM